MSDKGFRRFWRIGNSACIFVGLSLSLNLGGHSHLRQFSLLLAPFAVMMFVGVWLGRRRPGHSHDSLWDSLR